MKIGYISLGCPKNEIDLEYILGCFDDRFSIVHDPAEADCIIINTCAFIEPARQESIEQILYVTQYKKNNPALKVIVTGCMPQRYKDALQREIPEVDKYFCSNDIAETRRHIMDYFQTRPVPPARGRITASHFACLKIADGCDNRCSYCAIPLIKGPYKSRPFSEILDEAEALTANGVKELILVAQDTTRYGADFNYKKTLADVLIALNDIKGLEWIRLMYTHPAHWNDRLIETMAGLDKVVRYIDLPIQHISDTILEKMGRKVTRKQITALVEKLRMNIPGVALRTSIITGFPGETVKEFRELLQYLAEVRFERLGVFTYSHEEDTRAFSLADNVSAKVKKQRQEKIMDQQAEISAANNEKLIGQIMDVIIDEEYPDNNLSFGRTRQDAPEIDNSVIVKPAVPVGDIRSVKIIAANEYELYADLI
ncbi:MAG TPA: 30S ribosomal protein S12 methylthiotransferase RimO [bacterium]|nr:30S ribosomal protein S12 methylthiotransferase RimO [bacterium]HPN42073.1 30S ribosomal protein S12 methylthiotransferase RimO [bacterium]